MSRPEAAIKFFNELDAKAKANPGKTIRLDFSRVTVVKLDAMTALLAACKDARARYGCKLSWVRPRSKYAQKALLRMGFYRLVEGAHADARLEQGGFASQGGFKSDPVTASKITYYALNRLDIPLPAKKLKMGGLQRTIVECMSNTRGHADPRGVEKESWTLSCLVDDKEGVAHFCFVDMGVGILRSGNISRFRAAIATLKWADTQGNLLNSVFDGDVKSRTKLGGRGEGLPAMKDDLERNLISNLRVLANRGFITVGEEIHGDLRNEFSGTLICWDVDFSSPRS